MKSYTTSILLFSLAFYLSVLAILMSVWWLLLIGGICWIIALWVFYFTERSNIARFRFVSKAIEREHKYAAADRLEADGTIAGLENELQEAKTKKKVVSGGHLNFDEIRQIVGDMEKEETA